MNSRDANGRGWETATEATTKLADGPLPILAEPTHMAPAADIVSRFKDAYAVAVIGKAPRRHVFFGLAAAQKAVERAHARGDFADLVLVQLVPVRGGAQ